MKLPNWLHRKPARPIILDWPDGVTPPDPYLNSLLATPTESVEGAHTRGYWEGRAENAAAIAANKAFFEPEYSVEIIRNDDGSGDNSIEEILLHDATRCLFLLERTDTDHWWITLSPTGEWDDEVAFDLFRVKKCIEVTEQ